jgi:hypothetical protein
MGTITYAVLPHSERSQKPDIDLKVRRNYPRERPKIRGELVAVFIKRPLYFSIPLNKMRPKFIIFFTLIDLAPICYAF